MSYDLSKGAYMVFPSRYRMISQLEKIASLCNETNVAVKLLAQDHAVTKEKTSVLERDVSDLKSLTGSHSQKIDTLEKYSASTYRKAQEINAVVEGVSKKQLSREPFWSVAGKFFDRFVFVIAGLAASKLLSYFGLFGG